MAVDKSDYDIARGMYAASIGEVVMTYIDRSDPHGLRSLAESEAVKPIAKIRAVLDDDTKEDPDCFHRIDEIVRAFGESGLYTPRHDW